MSTRVGDDEVVASLSPFDTMPDWLLAGMDPGRVAVALRRHVRELDEGSLQLLSCTPQRLRAKGEEWLARYLLRVVGPEGDPRDVVLTGTLWPPSALLPRAEETRKDPVSFGDPGWSCTLPELRLVLCAQAHDEALPSLPVLTEPEAAARLLRSVLLDTQYDAVVTGCRPEVVRYKPGSRCTVVVHVDYESQNGNGGPPPPSPVVLKTHQGEKGQTAWAAMSALWDRQATWRESLTMAEPLGYLPDARILVQGPVPERCTLKELARRAFTERGDPLLAELRDELTKTAHALAAVHGSGARYGRTATIEDEIDEINEVILRLSLTVPTLAGAGEALVERLMGVAAEVPADPVVAAHHDFRPAQVLLHGGRVGFIDFDGASMAEPALDIGRFRAKLRDIGISALTGWGGAVPAAALAENLHLQDELCDHFLTAYRERATVAEGRVHLWETCDLLTGMLHAWTKVRAARLQPRLTVLRHHLGHSGLLGNHP